MDGNDCAVEAVIGRRFTPFGRMVIGWIIVAAVFLVLACLILVPWRDFGVYGG